MTGIEQLRERLNALQTLLAAAMADLKAMEDGGQEPPVVDPPPVDEPDEPVPVPEVPKGQRLVPIERLGDFEWPANPDWLAQAFDIANPKPSWRKADAAAGRWARFRFSPLEGKPLPGTHLAARVRARMLAPGPDGRIAVVIEQNGQEKTVLDCPGIKATSSPQIYSGYMSVDNLDPSAAIDATLRFESDAPGADRYEVTGFEIYVEHDGSGPAEPAEPEPSQPPAEPVDGKLIYAATPASAAHTEKVSGIDDWFKANIGGGFISDTSGLKGLSIAPAPDGKPALLLTLNPGSSKNQGFQIRRSLKGINAREATVSCDMWVPSKFRWRSKPGIKFLGLSNGKSVGAGNSYAPDEQQGAYSRVVWWLPDDLSEMYFGLYYYSRNRREKPDKNGKFWGDQHNSKVKVPRDRWFTVEHRLVLNDPGKANGLLSASLDGKIIIQLTGQDLQPSELGLRDSAHLYNESKGAKSENGEIFWSNFRCVVK